MGLDYSAERGLRSQHVSCVHPQLLQEGACASVALGYPAGIRSRSVAPSAAGFLPQLFVYDREAALATPDMLVYGQVQAQLELAAVSGQSAGREVEQQQQTSQTNFQRNGPALPPARCDVATESRAS